MKSTAMENVLEFPQQPDKSLISGVSVILDFGHGHISRRGESGSHYSQSDVIDCYSKRLVEELEAESVRLHPVETRKPPGFTYTDRLKEAPRNFLPLVLSCDFFDKTRLHNGSVIEYQGAQYLKMAERIGESLSDWGRCYVWGHRVSRPILVQGAPRDYIAIKPFALNGPHAADYLQRLDKLGETLGRAVGGYLLEANMGRIRKR